jgi:hypothetical protein
MHIGVEERLHSLLTSALGGGEWLTSRSDPFTPRKQRRYELNSLDETHKGSDVSDKRKIPYRNWNPGLSSTSPSQYIVYGSGIQPRVREDMLGLRKIKKNE